MDRRKCDNCGRNGGVHYRPKRNFVVWLKPMFEGRKELYCQWCRALFNRNR